MNPPIQPEVGQLSRFMTAFNFENDRGAALSAASMLDERLQEILNAFFADIPETKQLLHGFNAPLSSFAARAAAAHALGLIETSEFQQISLIRKIRNKFGHSWDPKNFSDPPICDWARALPWRGPGEAPDESNQRSRFNVAVAVLLADLIWRVQLVEKEKRIIKVWPNKTGL